MKINSHLIQIRNDGVEKRAAFSEEENRLWAVGLNPFQRVLGEVGLCHFRLEKEILGQIRSTGKHLNKVFLCVGWKRRMPDAREINAGNLGGSNGGGQIGVLVLTAEFTGF